MKKIKHMDEKKILADSLNDYIKKKHTQDECIGFIDGFKEALRQYAIIKSKNENKLNSNPDKI